MAGAPRRDWIVVYDVRADEERLERMQAVSLDDSDFGLAPDPLVGGGEWWDEIGSGRRRTFRIEGTIERVYWGSMGDWPEFRIRALDGSESDWTREGDARRYVEGLGMRLAYVLSRREGEVRHYLRFATADEARAAERELTRQAGTSRVYDDRFSGSWFVQVSHDDPLSARRLRDELGELARRNGGSYDGGEIVGGDVWGAGVAA